MLPTLTSWPDFPKGLKVLLLEAESKHDSECTESLLKAASYDVTTCSKAGEAIQHLKGQHAFHLVLADYGIFAIETGENLRLLRMLKKSRKALPFLLLSESSTPSEVLEAVKLGAAEVIPKPLSPLKAKTLWQHTVRNMMVKSHALELSADDSDSISLEQPRTPSVNGCGDAHPACEACSSDSTNDLQDMLSFDLDCAEFNLDQLVGMPESALALSEPPNPESLEAGSTPPSHPLDHPVNHDASPMSSAAPSPTPPCSSSQPLPPAAAAPSLQQPMPGSCAPFSAPAPTPSPPSTCLAPSADTPAPDPAALPQHCAATPPVPGIPPMGVPPIAGGFPMWGVPPMAMIPGMMAACPPFMMPPFMRPFGPMGMPPMPRMPMMPFPMCPMPFGMPPMMCPPPPFALPPAAPMQPADASAACPTTSAAPYWGMPAQPVACAGQQQDVAQPAQQQQQQQQQQPQQQAAAQAQQQAAAPAQQEAQQQQEQQQQAAAAGTCAPDAQAALSSWFDSAECDEPPLGLQLKKSNSLLDLLSQHLFNSAPTCAS